MANKISSLKRYLNQEVLVFIRGTLYTYEEGQLLKSNHFSGILYELDDHFAHLMSVEDSDAITSVSLTEITAIMFATETDELLRIEVPEKARLN